MFLIIEAIFWIIVLYFIVTSITDPLKKILKELQEINAKLKVLKEDKNESSI